ncbi:hypothetical protein FS837_011240 [Tulasnella sp. UAMH 9824]|nr:hypothetical protein FS837_011240 [Tulasnella sp. UAMH 9824]
MASTTSTVDADSITVVARSASTASHTRTPYFPPFPPKKFISSPGTHGLPRTGLQAASEESWFLAAIDAITCRVQELSLSEPPAHQATAPSGRSVYVGTTPDSTTVNASPRRKFFNCPSKMFSKCTRNVGASFRRMVLKSSEKTKKARGVSPPNSLPALATVGLAGVPMEGVQQPSSLQPTSAGPIPMELEAELPSSNAASVPEPRQTLVDPTIDRNLDAPVADSSDTIMGDPEEDVSRATEVMQQTEAVNRTLVSPVATQIVSSTPLNQDVDMEDADNSRSRFTSLQQASTLLPPAVRDEASKEAGVKAFFAQLKTSRAPAKSQPKPTPPPRSSEPKQTKGSAARSLMDDLMAGFRSATKGKPSQQPVPMAVDPPAQPHPVATTTLHASLAVLPKLPRRTTPLVAGRQPGPQLTPPHHVGTGSEATAPGGSMIPPSEAPSTAGIPTIGKVKGPSAGKQVQAGFTSGAAPSGTASDAAMDGVESGRAVKGSRRATRAIARAGWSLETAQQKTREAQAAQDVENSIEAALAPASSLRALEKAKSSAWHAAQPPPPPEAMPYIAVGKKFRRPA